MKPPSLTVFWAEIISKMGDIINVFQTDIKMNIDTRTFLENQHSTCNAPTNYANEYMKMSQRSKIQVAFHSSFLTQVLQFFMGRDRDSLPFFHDNTHPSGISNLKTSITSCWCFFATPSGKSAWKSNWGSWNTHKHTKIWQEKWPKLFETTYIIKP